MEETFAYDIYGNVVNKTATVLDYNASAYGISYEYDHAGNVTRVTYIPGHLILQNETVTGIISSSAADSITAGPAYTIASGASAVLQAGKKVILKPGFTAAQGSYFNAKIDPVLTQDVTVVAYSYDALGRLISVGTPSDADFYASYTYHAGGRLNSEKLATSLEIRNHFYNSPGWLLRINGNRFTEDITHTTGWSGAAGYYDGRIKTTSFIYNWAGEPADYAAQYTYDNLGQLTSADNNLNNAWDIGIGNPITFDANGNIVDLRRGSTTKTYSYYAGTNKVQNTDGAGNDYTYDSNANVVSASPKSISTISYDSFTQRPTSVNMGSGQSMTLEYGGVTQRVLKDYSNGTSVNSKLYLHGQNDYPLIEKNRVSVTAETSAVYIYGPSGAIAKRVGNTVLFLLKDHLGSTRVVMDATGLVRSYYDYDALGNLIRTGTTNEVKYQFTGQEYDESGVHNYRARLYDSDLGKLYATDPAGEFAGSYLYAGNNPISYTDPTGEFINLVAFAYYAYQAYQYASYAYTAYSLFQATRQGGFSGFVQAAVTMGAGAVVGGSASSLVGGNSLGGSILSGVVGGAAGGAASSYVMGGNIRAGATMGGVTGGLTGALSYGASTHLMLRDFQASGTQPGQPIEASQTSLDNFIDKHERLLEMQDKADNPDVLLATKKNTTGALRFNEQTGLIEKTHGGKTISALGVTTGDLNNPIKLANGAEGYRSTIRIAPKAFQTARTLYFTIGHELIHSFQFYSGLAYQWKFNNTMEYHAIRVWDMPTMREFGIPETTINSYFLGRLKQHFNFR